MSYSRYGVYHTPLNAEFRDFLEEMEVGFFFTTNKSTSSWSNVDFGGLRSYKSTTVSPAVRIGYLKKLKEGLYERTKKKVIRRKDKAPVHPAEAAFPLSVRKHYSLIKTAPWYTVDNAAKQLGADPVWWHINSFFGPVTLKRVVALRKALYNSVNGVPVHENAEATGRGANLILCMKKGDSILATLLMVEVVPGQPPSFKALSYDKAYRELKKVFHSWKKPEKEI